MQLNLVRESYLRHAFSSLLIPRVNKHFASWGVAEAFVLEQTTLQFRLADEFEMIEAPDILAIGNNKNRENNLIGESCVVLQE